MAELDMLALLLETEAYRDGGVAGLAAASADDNPALRFFDNLRKATLSSIDLGPVLGTMPTVFVLSAQSARLNARTVDLSAVKLADIDLRQPQVWEGKLVFTAPHATGGWAIPLPNGSVDDALELLDTNGFGNLPVAIVYPERRALSCFQDGGASESAPIRLDLPAFVREVSIAALFEVLEDVRRNSLLTPQIGPPGFWTDGSQYQPGPEAERQIQWVVQAQLRSNFRPLLVDTEQVIPEGRIDVLLTNPTPTPDSPLYPAIVELKVLKSKTHTGGAIGNYKNIRAVLKGLRQTKAYRESKQAKFSILGCFDMRGEKDDILSAELCVLARAKYFNDDRCVAYIFPVYGTTDDAQEVIAAIAV